MTAPTFEDVLTFAASLTDEPSRASALEELASRTPAGRGGEILDRAEKISEEYSRGRVLHALIRSGDSALVPQLLDSASRLTRAYARALVLTDLLPHLAENERSRSAEEVARLLALVGASSSMGEAYQGLARYLSPERMASLLDTWMAALPGEAERADLRSSLSGKPLRPNAQAAETWDEAAAEKLAAALDAEIAPYRLGESLPDEWPDLILLDIRLNEMISRLPADRRPAAARTAVQIRNGHCQFQLETVLPYLTQAEIRDLIGFVKPIYLSRGFGDIAEHLDPAHLPELLDAVIALEPEWVRGEGLMRAAGHLGPDLLDRAVVAAVAIRDPEQRVHSLAGIVEHLPVDRRPATVDAALLAATGIPLATDRAFALVTLAEALPAEERDETLAAAFTAIRKDRSEGRWLTQLIRLLPPSRRR
ncbi:hypothetical protein [Actinoplanes derwentensis]|uniref:HEAT repeat-containing protein n=1 Tax=Actinoplanes derwentensis TaxID=113562 RepID=A0A1H2DD55_9ACTN|nr:hypothetical protein [Actinoplanes derwentensis]GID89644.1 hypothetical protein Ade03nite_85680 [Actinoplanes derwentensis]SDT80688.1 hypothetical protein SAMN04489716_9314 [Actinoplanes derwentensis]